MEVTTWGAALSEEARIKSLTRPAKELLIAGRAPASGDQGPAEA